MKPTFLLPGGRRVAALSAREMREVDRIATDVTGPGLLQMMENAGRSLAQLAIRISPSLHPGGRLVILAGPGGNGGGGICAARHLASRVGCVDVCLSVPAERLSSAAGQQLRTYLETGRVVVGFDELVSQPPPDLIIDALIGYGLSGAPRGETARLIEWANRSRASVLSLDVPSGLDPDTGEAPGACIRSLATLTLHMPKPGLVNPGAGELYLADLGIPLGVSRRLGVEPPNYGPDFLVTLEREAGTAGSEPERRGHGRHGERNGLA